jgi:YHS domain-containing protein
MATDEAGPSRDPICGLPLTAATAEETAEDARGTVVMFCSPGCLDTWQRRPTNESGVGEDSGPVPGAEVSFTDPSATR